MKTNSPYRVVLEHALAHALAHLEQLDQRSVSAVASLAELRASLARPLIDDGIDAPQVIDQLVTDVAGGMLGSASGRFFGWVIGGALPAAVAADWLTSAWDQNAAIYACGPAESVIEEVCGEWLKELLEIPPSASFALVTGSQMAHVTCLAAARNALLARTGWDVERKGLIGAANIDVLTGNQRHGSIERAVRLLGLGRESIVDLPVDDDGRLQVEPLDQALRARREALTIVLLQAGDLNIGAYDRFADLIPLAHEYGAWVHIDGAFGLWVATAPKYRHLIEGIELADSWTADGHKWLNVPYDCGYAFVADPKAHQASMSHRSSYMMHEGDARDEIDWNPEWSRRGRGVATYVAIRQLGRRGIGDLVERTCHHAHALVSRIGALPGAELVWASRINQGLVRFHDPRSGATEADHDQCTDQVIDAVLRGGEAFFGGTTWRDRRCMRVSMQLADERRRHRPRGRGSTTSTVDATGDQGDFMNCDAKVLTKAIGRALSGKSAHVEPSAVFSRLHWKVTGMRPGHAVHSVFQLLNHMVFWQDWVVSWLDGEKPPNTSNSWPGGDVPANGEEWERAVRRFQSGLKELTVRSREMTLLSMRGRTSRLEMLETVASHNSYHAGQVVILRQILRVWPPLCG